MKDHENIVAKFEDLKTLRFFGLLIKEAPPLLVLTAQKIFLNIDPDRLAKKLNFL